MYTVFSRCLILFFTPNLEWEGGAGGALIKRKYSTDTQGVVLECIV